MAPGFNLHMWETQLNFPVVLFIYHIFFNIFVFSKLYMCLTGVCFAPNYHFHVVLLMINGTREYFLQDDTLKRAVAAYRGKSWKKIGTICYSLIHDTFCKKWPIECELDVQFFIALQSCSNTFYILHHLLFKEIIYCGTYSGCLRWS